MEYSRSKRRNVCEGNEEDWPVLATALALNCAIWTEDTYFFGTGIAVWTTSHIEIFLKGAENAMRNKD